MIVAAVQMVSTSDVEHNVRVAENLIHQACDQDAEMVVLPEYFFQLGLRAKDKLQCAEQDGAGMLQDFLSGMALRCKAYIVGGTIALKSEDAQKVYNSSLVYAPNGERIARYDKIHLFCFDNGREHYDESDTLCAGKSPCAFNISARDGQNWRIALSVRYDVRFPELYRSLQADLICVPSSFTYVTGQAHWEVLLRARAIENLALVCASAQGGAHENGRKTWGHSMLLNPWGEILAQQNQGEGVVLADCDYDSMQLFRRQLPSLDHRKL